MRPIKVNFSDGNYIITSINGEREEILQYYLGKFFELYDEKPCVKCVSVEFLEV